MKRNGRKGDLFAEVAVGVFMLGIIALLAYFTIIISGVDVLHGRHKVVAKVEFTDVGGLKNQDSVMYRGMKVGSVEDIVLSPSNIHVVVEINQDVVLRENYRASVCNLSMLGGNYLLLEEGEGKILPLDKTLFKGEKPTNWMNDISEIARNLNAVVSGGELKSIITNINDASVMIKGIVARLERGEGSLGKLLSSNDTAYVALETSLMNISNLTANANNPSNSIGRIISDNGQLYDRLSGTLENAESIAAGLKNGEGVIGRLLKKDDPLVEDLPASIAAFRKTFEEMDMKKTIAGAEKLMDNLNKVADKLNAGEGTLGKLVTDDELYREINGLAKDLRQVIDNYRDTTPISTFGSLIMGGL